ncbi:MAG TPA: class I SAM-dependent methyltransferase [Pyrinomonadaceae bacterium]|jgi:2-polyprenyl-3-methyl-5-hydroxy-6-metoxy-1,4-benzoquinol methylase
MESDYRGRLFKTYNATHIAYLDADDQAKLEWFSKYAASNYLPLLTGMDKQSAEVLEVACNKGYLLKALATHGFRNLRGVDLSPEDVSKARAIAPEAEIAYADAALYLREQRGRFDIIILKAMLEHVPKNETLPLLEKLRAALKPNGLVIIDVPNMDWLFAAHERYMDFTHETGFTRDSLAQVMRNVFDDVRIVPSTPVVERGLKTRIGALLRPAVISLAGIFLRIISEGASDVWWHSRSIIGTGRNSSGK